MQTEHIATSNMVNCSEWFLQPFGIQWSSPEFINQLYRFKMQVTHARKYNACSIAINI